MDTKKRRGSKVSLRAYPYPQALALPLHEDKQLQACPRQMMLSYTTTYLPHACYIRKDSTPMNGVHLIIYIQKEKDSRRRISFNQPTRTSLLHHRCMKFKFARFGNTDR